MPNDVMHLGPLKVIKHSWSDTSIYDANDNVLCCIPIAPHVNEGTQDECEREQTEIAELFADAPAAALALALICAGVAEVVNSDGPAFRLWTGDGWNDFIQQKHLDTWTATIEAIGWTRCREALAARGGV